MRIKYFILSTIIFFLPAYTQHKKKGKQDTRPNIILITPDKIGVDQFKQYGGLNHKTPAIDYLANNGITFFYCVGRTDGGAGTRAIMSGASDVIVGSDGVFFEVSKSFRLAQKLDEVGYDTCFAGRWAFNNASEKIGDIRSASGKSQFSTWGPNSTRLSWPWDEGFKNYHSLYLRYNGSGFTAAPEQPVYYDGKTFKQHFFKFASTASYMPQRSTDFIKAFIDHTQRKKKRKPFYIWWAMIYMYHHRDEYLIKTPKVAPIPTIPTSNIAKVNYTVPKIVDYKFRSKLFYHNLHYMDKMIGQVLDKLREYKILDNTLIIFHSLSGTPLGVRGIYDGFTVEGNNIEAFSNYTNGLYPKVNQTQVHLEKNLRMPLLVHWPKFINKPHTTAEMVDVRDILPTIAKVAKVKDINRWRTKDYHQSYSFLPILKGHRNKGQRRKYAYFWVQGQFVNHNTCEYDLIWAQTKEYKLYNDGRFYRLREEPNEFKKAIRLSPLEKTIKKKLKKIINAHPTRRPANNNDTCRNF